jgi:hypothetical protein
MKRSPTRRAVIGSLGLTFLSCREYPKKGITAVIRRADARFKASIVISCSMMLSFMGSQWLCMT